VEPTSGGKPPATQRRGPARQARFRDTRSADLALSLVVRLAIVGAPEFVDLSLVAC
jgi:hypothetical protein